MENRGKMKTCKDCRYSHENKEYWVQDCRRYPPKIIVYSDDSSGFAESAFPRAIGPCGEFKQREDEADEPSIPLSRVKQALIAGSDAFVFSEVFALVQEAETEAK